MNNQQIIKYRFYSSTEYVKELLTQLNQTKPGGRILLTTMGFHPDEPPVDEIMSSLRDAAKRGVATTLLVDAHAFLIKSRVTDSVPGPLWYGRKLSEHLPRPYEYRLQSLRSLSNEPAGDYAIINPPNRRFRLTIAGRSHIKLAIIDDTVFIGGYNLQSSAVIDMMVGLTDKSIAEWLYKLCKEIQADKQVWRVLGGLDLSRQVDSDTQLLIDAGMPNQSIILKSAIKLINEAQEWILITCQFFPNSQTAKALVRAHKRGVKVEIIFSHPNMHGFIGSAAHRANMLRERLRVPNHFFDGMLAKTNTMLHAKLLATDCGTIIGSHNFVQVGVQLGTAELALFSRNTNFTSEALAALERSQAA